MSGEPYPSVRTMHREVRTAAMRTLAAAASDAGELREWLSALGLRACVKRCPRCGLVKDRSEYRQNAARRDGLDSKCTACAREYYRNRLLADAAWRHAFNASRRDKYHAARRREVAA